MSKTPETILKDEVTEYLTKAGIFFRRQQSGKVKVKGGWMQLCPEGTADFLVCLPRRMPLWLELKGPGQKTAKDRQDKQAAFAREVLCLGHRYERCETLDEVISALKGHP